MHIRIVVKTDDNYASRAVRELLGWRYWLCLIGGPLTLALCVWTIVSKGFQEPIVLPSAMGGVLPKENFTAEEATQFRNLLSQHRLLAPR
jgi:hypothetical protein